MRGLHWVPLGVSQLWWVRGWLSEARGQQGIGACWWKAGMLQGSGACRGISWVLLGIGASSALAWAQWWLNWVWLGTVARVTSVRVVLQGVVA